MRSKIPVDLPHCSAAHFGGRPPPLDRPGSCVNHIEHQTGDALRTAETLRELEQLYRLSVLADGLMLVSYIVVTAMLYRLLKPVR